MGLTSGIVVTVQPSSKRPLVDIVEKAPMLDADAARTCAPVTARAVPSMSCLSTTAPRVKAAYQMEQPLRRRCSFPVGGGALINLRPGRADINGAKELVQADAVPHRKNKLDDQITRPSEPMPCISRWL